ncbi:hypothetical protein BURMUCF2_A0195 [Burkholderia multivorans CF2]|nr:hypothetical protein BURMUCF2_A0195 [Burkholderia multivorans CF2]
MRDASVGLGEARSGDSESSLRGAQRRTFRRRGAEAIAERS